MFQSINVKNIFRRRPLTDLSMNSNGYFDQLPLEIVYYIFEKIPLHQIGNFALTSEKMRILVSNWISTAECLRRAYPTLDDESLFSSSSSSSSSLKASSSPALTVDAAMISMTKKSLGDFAILCKRVTTLLNTKERIKFMTTHFHNCLSRKRKSRSHPLRLGVICEESETKTWEVVEYFVHFGYMLSKFIRGWDESEYLALFRELDRLFAVSARLGKYLQSFSTAERLDEFLTTGGGKAEEKNLRLILRTLWWDMLGSDNSFKADWLLANINRFVGTSPRKQAITIYLMFGPVMEKELEDENNNNNYVNPLIGSFQQIVTNDLFNNVNWLYMTQDTPLDFHEGRNTFYRMAQCVCHLSHSSRYWRYNSLIGVLDKLFSLPDEWMRDNISAFLLFCNETVILDYMFMKLNMAACQDVHIENPARLLVNIMIESHKFDNELIPGKGVGNVVDRVLSYASPAIRSEFLETIWEILLLELEDTTQEIPIEEVIVSFGKFVSKKSVYLAKKEDKNEGVRCKKKKMDHTNNNNNDENNDDNDGQRMEVEE